MVACLAVDVYGDALNVNADDAAGAVAGALRCTGCVFKQHSGRLRRPGGLGQPHHHTCTKADVQARIEDGRISGGMIPKVEAALERTFSRGCLCRHRRRA